ncbi:sodium ion-translocating decarboxylase subunit beta [uncultured Leptotrichia sp.]|uniref:sodium ion-translocating decarboxylase subunit beta n=1 Tax=uncultured Leptotrichia sp. TaxID=159271 RepID=UPI0026245BDE|nr:sodium ion-translocating decarboxylase subunit beta [uncultured Leptotrichia sp.]
MELLKILYGTTGISMITGRQIIMIIISLILLYLAIKKQYEPYLLLPISFGMLLANLPAVANEGLMEKGGLLYYLYQGVKLGIYPPLIFLAIGASTDFGPLIANPKSLLLGAAAQLGIFIAFIGAILLGLTGKEAASIGIIGGADGPTAIYLTTKLAPHLLGSIAIAAYSYMALVPVIQPPIIKLLTTKKERTVEMTQLRFVSQREKIIFPIAVTIIVILLVPSSAPLIGMLMLGNLIKEAGVVSNLVEHARGAMLYCITIVLGITVGATADGEHFLSLVTIKIIILGLIAFSFGTVGGVLFGKIMYKLTKGKVNPMIGAAGVSAVPMAARVVQKLGQEENPKNFLLMHAMGPNVAGVIGTAVAAGTFMAIFGVK